MKAFAVNYDLRKPGRDYSGLYEAIKETEYWWHYLGSTWLVVTEQTANEIWTRLAPHIDRNDRMLIIEVRDNVQGWLPTDAWQWIHARVPQ